MIIEIRKAGFVNKGAELMLHAVVQQVRARYPQAKITMPPVMGRAEDTFEKMRELRLYPKAWLWVKGIEFGQFSRFLPNKLLNRYGIIADREVDAVLDAAGFSYSDQWGAESSRELAKSTAKWKSNGTKVVLLPQAMGPFTTKNIVRYVRKWSVNSDLVFPRDPESYRYLTELLGEQKKIQMFPDFTNLVRGTIPDGYDASDKRVAIIPNYRMVDKTSRKESEAYRPFLIRIVKYLVEKGKKPFFLVHEGANDHMLAEQVSEESYDIPIVKEANALHIKGILGTCDATVGSRFHGLVSSLSQGVPSLATAWSHKYRHLFEDYNFVEGLIAVTDSDESLNRKLDLITNAGTAEELRDQLRKKATELEELSKKMWGQVFALIDEVAKE